jgi:hypothetical protein
MAGPDPAIYVSVSYDTADCGCLDARIKSGHNEWLALRTI